jgi:hypothetical protein
MAVLNNGSDPAVKRIIGTKPRLTGPEVTNWLRGASFLTQLAVAAAWLNDEVEIDPLTPTQKARALGLRPEQAKQAKAIAALPPEQREALTTRRQTKSAASMSDAVLDDLVERVGVVRVLASVDRHTMPKPNGNGHHVTA